MLKRSWTIAGSSVGSDDKWARNIRVLVFAETPEEAIAQFRQQFPKAHPWTISHSGQVIVADESPR